MVSPGRRVPLTVVTDRLRQFAGLHRLFGFDATEHQQFVAAADHGEAQPDSGFRRVPGVFDHPVGPCLADHAHGGGQRMQAHSVNGPAHERLPVPVWVRRLGHPDGDVALFPLPPVGGYLVRRFGVAIRVIAERVVRELIGEGDVLYKAVALVGLLDFGFADGDEHRGGGGGGGDDADERDSDPLTQHDYQSPLAARFGSRNPRHTVSSPRGRRSPWRRSNWSRALVSTPPHV